MYASLLFEALTLVFEPPVDVSPPRVLVGPVYNAAALIPLVLPEKRHRVAGLEATHARCQVNIVRDEQRLAGPDPDNKPLVPTAVVVIR